MRIYLLFILILLIAACDAQPGVSTRNMPAAQNDKKAVPVYTFEIVKTYPHDKNAFTQGLVFFNEYLYESTGQNGESSLRKVELESGKVLRKHDLEDKYFAEGMTILDNQIYQLTWRSGKGFVYDISDFKVVKEFRYNGEGWGLTNDGQYLFLSDGTHIIRVVDPVTFETIRTIVVLEEDGKPLYKINELEFIKGEIWANIWHSEDIRRPNQIARIDPKDGRVVGWVDLDGISPDDVRRDSENTLNGIAYDADSDRLFVTGKNWKNLFEIRLRQK